MLELPLDVRPALKDENSRFKGGGVPLLDGPTRPFRPVRAAGAVLLGGALLLNFAEPHACVLALVLRPGLGARRFNPFRRRYTKRVLTPDKRQLGRYQEISPLQLLLAIQKKEIT